MLCLLNQSSFSKHLTAVREANILFKRAMDLRTLDAGASVKVGVSQIKRLGIQYYRAQ